MINTLGFSPSYEAEILPGLPGYGDVHRFHLQTASGHAEGLVVAVRPFNSVPWVGNFTLGGYGTSGVYATPAEDRVCVVAEGDAYIVDVDQPSIYVNVASQVGSVVRGDSLLLLVKATDIIAHTGREVVWRTVGLASDGIEVQAVEKDELRGMAWSAPRHDWVPFCVKLATGEYTGGAWS